MTLTIDGHTAAAHGSLLDAILAAGLDLPHLCKDDHLPAIGACRTCLVEADGRVVAACSVPAASATAVETATDRVRRLRRAVLELTAAMQSPGVRSGAVPLGPHGHEFADSLAREGADPAALPPRPRDLVDASNPFFEFHEAACILCGRCTTACQSLQHIGAIGLAGRGNATRVTPGASTTFLESICTSCGSCVAACPTSALRPKGPGP
jgi:formate dehydrogenase major subunit